MKYELRPYQKEASEEAVKFLTDDRRKGNGLLVMATGCHAKGYPIMMSDGSLKNVEDIKVGDKVMGDDGKPRNVLSLHRGEDDMYRIVPKKGEPFVVNGGHILSLYRTRRWGGDNIAYDEISVRDYLRQNKSYKHLHKLYRLEGLDCFDGWAVEPYFMGLFIGDGCSVSGLGITTRHKEVVSFLYDFADKYGFNVRVVPKGSGIASSYMFTHSEADKNNFNPLKSYLMRYELFESRSGDKFIPKEFKYARREDRLLLLGGLIDTDTYYDEEKNVYEYCTKSKRLAYDIQFLCRSVGLYASIRDKFVEGVNYYRLQISGDLDIIPNRVAERKGKPRKQRKSIYVEGFSVESIGRGEYYGFTLDGNHLYVDWQYFIHHNCGKSLVIADIAKKLNSEVLVFQPSKEILMQNYKKMKTYTDDCAMYSASVGKKNIAKVTFATIGSAKSYPSLFKQFKYIIVDEAHTVNPSEGMYFDFFNIMNRKIIGLTATPYRLQTEGQKWDWKNKKMDMSDAVSMLVPIVGNGQVFSEVLYNVDTQYLLREGFLAPLRYFDVRPPKMDMEKVFKNTVGTDFSKSSLRWMEEHCHFYEHMESIIKRLQHPKSGVPRHGILVFVRLVELAEHMTKTIPSAKMVSGKTPKKERERILDEFNRGEFQVLLNCSTLVCGYDRPDLDTIVLGTPTMSLSRYYQEVGRGIRPFEGKDGWIVDLCGNTYRFGEVHKLVFRQNAVGDWNLYNDRRQLTNVPL